MLQITLSDEQARLIANESQPIVLVDSKGQPLGQVAPIDPEMAAMPALSAEELAEIKRRMQTAGPGLTTKELFDYLHSLDNA